MQQMKEFDFFIPDSKDVKVVQHLISKMELHDEHICYIEECYVNCEDELGVKSEGELRKHFAKQLRSKITGCSKHWYNKQKIWGVEINLMGVAENMNPCFKREYQAQEFMDALIEWLLKK
jgi:hypothetical protein